MFRLARQREGSRCWVAWPGPRTARFAGTVDGPACLVRPRAVGFTLIEVVTVLGLLVLLAAIAWPIMENRITKAELPESAARVRDMLFMVRAESATEHRRYRIRFEPEQQHPLIEYEPDPILRPNEWEEVESAWAREASDSLLLADVQVYEIRPGRPLYLEAISINDDPSTLLDEAEQELEDAEEAAEEGFDTGSAQSALDEEDIEIDEDRPIILFEADGSTEWVTIVLTRVPLDEVLEEDSEQTWVVVDGRTGLASIRESVTEEQLADPEFYVQREKLEPPDTVDLNSLTFQVGLGGEAVASTDGKTAGGSGGADAAPGDGTLGDSPDGDALGDAVAGQKDGEGGDDGDNPHGDDSGRDADLKEEGDGSGGTDTSEENRRRDDRKPRRKRGG